MIYLQLSDEETIILLTCLHERVRSEWAEQLNFNQRVQGSSPVRPPHSAIEIMYGFRLDYQTTNMDVLRKVPKRFQECAVRCSASGWLAAASIQPRCARREQYPAGHRGWKISWLMGSPDYELGVRSSILCAPGDWQGVVGESPTR